jgi:hypothetical protein
MAKKTTASPRFNEVVFHGKPKVVKAFLKGLLMGAGHESRIYYNFDEKVQSEGAVEKFKEMFGTLPVDCRVIVDSETSAYLKQMASRIAAETGLRIGANRSVRSASVTFEYHAYAPQYNEEIIKLLQNLPKGVKLEGYRHDEKRDRLAKGVEAYSVAHDFEAEGKGTITGRVDLLIDVRRSLDDYPLIKAGHIELKMA